MYKKPIKSKLPSRNLQKNKKSLICLQLTLNTIIQRQKEIVFFVKRNRFKFKYNRIKIKKWANNNIKIKKIKISIKRLKQL